MPSRPQRPARIPADPTRSRLDSGGKWGLVVAIAVAFAAFVLVIQLIAR
jgi:hypothetical protein